MLSLRSLIIKRTPIHKARRAVSEGEEKVFVFFCFKGEHTPRNMQHSSLGAASPVVEGGPLEPQVVSLPLALAAAVAARGSGTIGWRAWSR